MYLGFASHSPFAAHDLQLLEMSEQLAGDAATENAGDMINTQESRGPRQVSGTCERRVITAIVHATVNVNVNVQPAFLPLEDRFYLLKALSTNCLPFL